MAAKVERTVRVVLDELDVKQIVAEYINEHKSKYGIAEVFNASEVKVIIRQKVTDLPSGDYYLDSVTLETTRKE